MRYAFNRKPVVYVTILVLSGACLLCACGWFSTTGVSPQVLMDVHTDFANDEYFTVNFSPDGATLIATLNGAQAQVWDTKTWEIIGTSKAFPEWPHDSPSYSPDGSRIVSVEQSEIVVRDSQSYQVVMRWKGDIKQVHSVVYSPDNKNILTTGSDATVRVWDAQSGTENLQFPVSACGDTLCELAAYYNTDGSLIATASADRGARFWDAKSGEMVSQIDLDGPQYGPPLWSVSFNPIDDNLAALGDNDVSVWSIREQKMIWKFEKVGWVLKTVFSPDGKKIAAMGWYGDVVILDAQTGAVIRDFSGYYRYVNSIAFSPDGHMLAVAGNQGFRVYAVPDD